MPCVTVDLSNVDWGLLRKQKLSLLKAVKIRAKTGASESAEHLRGAGRWFWAPHDFEILLLVARHLTFFS